MPSHAAGRQGGGQALWALDGFRGTSKPSGGLYLVVAVECGFMSMLVAVSFIRIESSSSNVRTNVGSM